MAERSQDGNNETCSGITVLLELLNGNTVNVGALGGMIFIIVFMCSTPILRSMGGL